jgi:hypothetical protein
VSSKHKFILLFISIVGLLILGAAVAIGRVEEKDSYGLNPILVIIGLVVSELCKTRSSKDSDDDKDNKN